ncbi:MAG: hypothetical protein MI922_07830, partial [Bacteroidales bacterium]|nr:hypothetical protein [Bacteroidales bacterium]
HVYSNDCSASKISDLYSSFTPHTSVPELPKLASNRMKIYPSVISTENEGIVEFSVTKSGWVQLTAVNMLGHELVSEQLFAMESETQRINWTKLNTLHNGTWIILLKDDNGIVIDRVPIIVNR